MNDQTTWGIHGGSKGDADALFLQQNCIALGWIKVGDLSQIDPNREAFKAAVWRAYPQEKEGAVPGIAGQLFRFVHEIAIGDLIIYVSKEDQEVHIGRVTGPYHYDLEADEWFHSIRPVQWLHHRPRAEFSKEASKAMAHRLTLVQIRSLDEFLPR